jgi:hypothetical protein
MVLTYGCTYLELFRVGISHAEAVNTFCRISQIFHVGTNTSSVSANRVSVDLFFMCFLFYREQKDLMEDFPSSKRNGFLHPTTMMIT